jgi:hypothetical protein
MVIFAGAQVVWERRSAIEGVITPPNALRGARAEGAVGRRTPTTRGMPRRRCGGAAYPHDARYAAQKVRWGGIPEVRAGGDGGLRVRTMAER